MVTEQAQKQLTRITQEAWVSGVCAGLAKHLGIDVLLIRILTVGLTLTVGVVPLIYVLMAFMVPVAPLPAGSVSTEHKWILWLMVFFLVFPLVAIIGFALLVITNAVFYAIMG